MSTIDDLVLARKLIGFTRLGTLPDEGLVTRAIRAVGALPCGPNMIQTKRLLTYMGGRIMPSMAFCTAGMNEIDAVLLPLRRETRSLQANEVRAETPRSFVHESSRAPSERG